MRGDRGDGRCLAGRSRVRRSPGMLPCGNGVRTRLVQGGKGGSWAARPRAELETVAPAGVEEDLLAGPLPLPDGRWAVLVLIAPPQQEFAPRHAELAQLLLEPFSIALGNHHRLSEMAALREAAEADKRSLLTRLGRSKLGDTIVGVESGLQAVMERVELVARSDVPVLIFGETGSGKELVARAIHNRSPRAAGPFIRVNCGAIPHELIDSQLFGHEKGAFTGAVEARKGWFERADGGTLLLDELGELTLAAQVRLLRVLQDGWLDRVGSQRPMSVDVRIVAATHRDLAAMVAEGKFREDLWYRIAVFPIRLPPLRERRDDIGELARHFAGRAATRFGLYPVMPSDEDLTLLKEYAWPGNVRELATVIDRAAILGDGKRLEVATALGIGVHPLAAQGGRWLCHRSRRKHCWASRRRRCPAAADNCLPGRGDAGAHRAGVGRCGRADRRPARRGALAANQSPHLARADAEVEDRLGPFPPGPARAGVTRRREITLRPSSDRRRGRSLPILPASRPG